MGYRHQGRREGTVAGNKLRLGCLSGAAGLFQFQALGLEPVHFHPPKPSLLDDNFLFKVEFQCLGYKDLIILEGELQQSSSSEELL